ncbi:hypothetical protein WA158_007668 [Blastocystis sp. Blastoise]
MQPMPRKSQHEKLTINNIYLMGWTFCFVVLGIKVAQSFCTALFGNIGSISMALLNYGCAFAYFFAPTIMVYFSSARAVMRFFSLEYGFYMLTFTYFIPALNLTWSLLHGVSGSILWTCELVFLAENSTEADRGWKSGVFWGIYMIGSIIGNVIIWAFLKYYGIESTGNQTGWLGSVSIMFLALALLDFFGCGFTIFFKDPFTYNKAAGEEYYRKQKLTRTGNPFRRFIDVLKLFITPKVLTTFFMTFFWGFGFGYVNGLFTRQIRDTSIIGLVIAYNSLLQVIFSFIDGYFIDKFGHYCVMIFTNINYLLGIIVSIYSDNTQDWLLYLASTLFAIGDTGYQTICPVLMTDYFEDPESVNSIFRFMECFSIAMGYTIAPFFVEEGETISSHQQYINESLITIGFLILSQISYSLFYAWYVVPHNKLMQQQKCIEMTSGSDMKCEINTIENKTVSDDSKISPSLTPSSPNKDNLPNETVSLNSIPVPPSSDIEHKSDVNINQTQ